MRERPRLAADAIILQSEIDPVPWQTRSGQRLPGTSPVDADDWLSVDDAYAQQMRLRETLIDDSRSRVIAMTEGSRAACGEALEVVLAALARRPDFSVGADRVTCPDGAVITLDRSDPLATLGRVVAEDICVLERAEGANEHHLSAAVLCFPSHWTLSEKLGRPLLRIHAPVDSYTNDMARRVQRLFDGLKPGRVLTRTNAVFCATPELFAPRSETYEHCELGADEPYFRSERQCLLKLPSSSAVLFSIHTRMIRRTSLTEAQMQGSSAYLSSMK